MKLLVQVADYHVRTGTRDCPDGCPVKHAIDVRLPAFWKARVWSFHVGIRNAKGSWIDIPLPDDVAKRIETFDTGGSMEPFEFELWIPDAMFL